MDNLPVDSWIASVTSFGIDVLLIFAIIFGSSLVGRIVRAFVRSRLTKVGFDETLGKFFLGLIKPLFIGLGIVLALAVFGIEPTSFAALIGAAGLAIGLSLQGALGNVASGLLILVFRPFKVGDVIEIASDVGKVAEITLFSTAIDTAQNIRILIPNGVAINGVIKNYSFHATRRVDISVGTDYGASLAEVRSVLEAAAVKVPNALLEPGPQVFLAALGASSIDWQVRIWSKNENYWQVFQDGTKIVKDAIDAADIGIPFPQLDVHLDTLETKSGA
ncbi:mechanosensitive ion channel family protein [Bacteroidota bacterium]